MKITGEARNFRGKGKNRFFLSIISLLKMWEFWNARELRVMISKLEGKLWRREGYYKKMENIYAIQANRLRKTTKMSNKNINRDKPCICGKKRKFNKICSSKFWLYAIWNTDIEDFKFQMIPYLVDPLLSKGAKKTNCYRL